MSSETGSTARTGLPAVLDAIPAAEAPGEQRRFRLAVGVTIIALVVAAAGLTVANAVQGPRLVSAEVNARASVERAGQRLVLRLDQRIEPLDPALVSVTPAVPYEVVVEQASIVLRFGVPLAYETRYDVVAPVRSVTTGAEATLTYALRTPGAGVFLLQRAGVQDGGGSDEIVRTVIGSDQRQILMADPRIQEFALADPELAVVTLTEENVGSLTVGRVSSGERRTVVDDASITQLKSSGSGGIFGFALTPRSGPDAGTVQLKLFDPAGDGTLVGAVGLDGSPLDPQDWMFVPGTRAVVVQTADSSLYVVDPIAGTPAQPLGGHTKMHSFVGDSATLIVDDIGEFKSIDLTTGVISPLSGVDLPTTSALYRLLDLGGERGYIGLLAGLVDGNLHFSVVTLQDGKIAELFLPTPPAARIPRVCLSPNAQYLAVETIPPGAAPDGYGSVPGYAGTRTVFLDTATGDASRSVPGFGVDWCH